MPRFFCVDSQSFFALLSLNSQVCLDGGGGVVSFPNPLALENEAESPPRRTCVGGGGG